MSAEEKRMHARMLSARVDREQFDELRRAVEEQVLPCAREQTGYAGSLGLYDRSSGLGMMITLWESAEDLEESECNGHLPAQLAHLMPFLDGPNVQATFEVIVSE